VRLAINLLGSCAGTNQSVKSGARAAGNRHKEKWKQHTGHTAHVESFECRLPNFITAEKNSNDAEREGGVENETAQVTARLK
jgi:hypothetical protein